MSTDHDIGYGWYRKSEDGKTHVELVIQGNYNNNYNNYYYLAGVYIPTVM